MKTVLPRFAPIPAPKAKVAPKVTKGIKPVPVTVSKAIDVMDDAHPAHAAFMAWLGSKPATKRQARKFCKLMGLKRAA